MGRDSVSVVVRCGSLIDGTGASPQKAAVIEIAGERIAGVHTDHARRYGPDTEVYDLSELTVLPGLVDCHEHLGLDIGDEEAQSREPLEYIAAKAAGNARRILMAGITTVRDVGEKDLIGVSLRRAIEDGIIPGPRMLVAGRNIVRTGGHGWFLGVEADGADGLRAAVRTEVARGADLIKTMATGGVSTFGSDALAPEFTEREIQALVDEAHTRGRKVAAHAHGGPGLRAAIIAGADSIEHGTFLTEEDAELMVKHGTYLVVTTGVVDEIVSRSDVPEFMKAKLADADQGLRSMLARVRGMGLNIVLGTDLNHGRLFVEMRALVEAGYEPIEAIQAGTKHGARLCGLGDDLGTIETGKFADLIAVRGDPLQDIEALASVGFVMQSGRVATAPPT